MEQFWKRSGLTPGECVGCKKKILWAELEGGGSVPLDPAVPVYHVTGSGDCGEAPLATLVKFHPGGAILGYMANHFSTCKEAARFSRKTPPAGSSKPPPPAAPPRK